MLSLYRRVYQGLLKLLDIERNKKRHESASKKDLEDHYPKKSREVGTLVEYVVLGQEVDLQGIIIIVIVEIECD